MTSGKPFRAKTLKFTLEPDDLATCRNGYRIRPWVQHDGAASNITIVRDAHWPDELLHEIDALIRDLETLKQKIVREEKRRRRGRSAKPDNPP